MKNIIKKWLEIDYMYWLKTSFAPCEKCYSLCQKDRMKKIKVTAFPFSEFEKYYCLEHAPEYDVIENHFKSFDLGQTEQKYYKNHVEVNEKGKPICTKK